MLKKIDKNVRLMLLPCDPRAWISGGAGMIDLVTLMVKRSSSINFVVGSIGLTAYLAYFGLTIWFWYIVMHVSGASDIFISVLVYLIAWFMGTIGGTVCTLWIDNGGKKIEL